MPMYIPQDIPWGQCCSDGAEDSYHSLWAIVTVLNATRFAGNWGTMVAT